MPADPNNPKTITFVVNVDPIQPAQGQAWIQMYDTSAEYLGIDTAAAQTANTTPQTVNSPIRAFKRYKSILDDEGTAVDGYNKIYLSIPSKASNSGGNSYTIVTSKKTTLGNKRTISLRTARSVTQAAVVKFIDENVTKNKPANVITSTGSQLPIVKVTTPEPTTTEPAT